MLALKPLASLVVWLAFLASTPSSPVLEETQALWVETATGRYAFTVEIAATPDEQSKGLMHRKVMDESHGMLFQFKKERRASFWMKNTFIPLDMLFLDAEGQIVNIVHNVEPHSLKPRKSKGKVLAVLELNGGLSQKLSISQGDRVLHRFFGNLPNDSQ